jgi:hypothetical protein
LKRSGHGGGQLRSSFLESFSNFGSEDSRSIAACIDKICFRGGRVFAQTAEGMVEGVEVFDTVDGIEVLEGDVEARGKDCVLSL